MRLANVNFSPGYRSEQRLDASNNGQLSTCFSGRWEISEEVVSKSSLCSAWGAIFHQICKIDIYCPPYCFLANFLLIRLSSPQAAQSSIFLWKSSCVAPTTLRDLFTDMLMKERDGDTENERDKEKTCARQDSNSQPLDHKASSLQVCYNCCPYIQSL